MATQDTVDLGESHVPQVESLKVFNEIEHELKRQLVHLRHDHDKHEPYSFGPARHLTDHELTAFEAKDFVLVRVATTAYGLILFGKLRIPALPTDANAGGPSAAFVHFRAFTDGPNKEALFHSFHTADAEDEEGHKTFRTLFTEEDPLLWFDS